MPSICGRQRDPLRVVAGARRHHAAARSAASSRAIRTYAPRILNEPVRCRFSHLSPTGPPHSSVSALAPAIGVCATTPARSARAACTSASPTGWVAAVTVASSQASWRYGG